MAVPTFHPDPHVEKGVSYWRTVPATVDGVLGGYGNGTLPVVDAQGSRAYLLEMLPRLQAVTPASHQGVASGSTKPTDDKATWLEHKIAARGGSGRAVTRALDCGAGVGRVTRDALSRIIDIVHLVEPVESFLDEAKASSSKWPALNIPPSKTPLRARKAVHFHLSTLQAFDPARPYSSAAAWGKQNDAKQIDRDATISPADGKDNVTDDEGARQAAAKAEPVVYDVIWGQWCLQHLSDKDLVSFLQRAQLCLREPDAQARQGPAEKQKGAVLDGAGIIVVKENVLRDMADGSENVWYDDEDHSITRTPNAYERCFKQAGLEIVDGRLQRGLPEELFPVMMWCLRVPAT